MVITSAVNDIIYVFIKISSFIQNIYEILVTLVISSHRLRAVKRHDFQLEYTFWGEKYSKIGITKNIIC